MSRKNFKVETAENGQTTITKIQKETKVPTGKVKTAKSSEERRKAREAQYKAFRVNALVKRASRMGLSEDEIKKATEKLLKQIDSGKLYDILLMFNPKDYNMIKEILANDTIAYKIMSKDYCYIEGDDELVADLRKLMPSGVRIVPYLRKKPPILPVGEQQHAKKAHTHTKAERKAIAAEAKKKRKQMAIEAHLNRKKHAEIDNEKKKDISRKAKKALMMFRKKAAKKALKEASGTTVQQKQEKPSETPKRASTASIQRHKRQLKQAA